MVIIRCTRKLLTRLRVPARESDAASSTRLGDWYANLLYVRGEQLILCVSERTLLPVVVPAKNAAQFPERLASGVEEVLRALGVAAPAINAELEAMNEHQFAKTASAQVLGSMNDLALGLLYGRGSQRSLVGASLELATTPCGPLKMESPDRVTVDLFRHGASVPRH